MALAVELAGLVETVLVETEVVQSAELAAPSLEDSCHAVSQLRLVDTNTFDRLPSAVGSRAGTIAGP